MNLKSKLLVTYLISLFIVTILAMIDSDPIISLSILLLEVLIMSILCWFLVLPIFFLLSKFIKGRN
jgi:hypothetical protein